MNGQRMIARSLVVLAILAPVRGWAWGNLGHQAVADVAERNLSKKAQQLVFEILGAEPLAIAAIFPDEVRAVPAFKDFANYHFLEIPEGKTAAEAIRAMAGKKH